MKQILAHDARVKSDGKDFHRKGAKVQRRKDLAAFLRVTFFSICFPLRLRRLCDFALKFFFS
jgi:hypothetical protein